MERDRRSSLLPAPRSLFCRRRPDVSTSEPVGLLSKQHRFAQSSDESRHSQDFVKADQSFASDLSNGSVSTVIHRDAVEHFSRPITPIITQLEKSSPTWPLPKSCTVNVFSNLPKPLSRSSLIPSRRVDTSSSMSSFSGATNSSFRCVSKSSHTSHIPVHISGRWSLGSPKNEQQHTSRDPYIIYDAQPSAYWTGRFMSLRDKFQSELLSPKNMESLIHVQKERTAAINQQDRQRRRAQSKKKTYSHRFSASLPSSATSAAVLQRETSGRRLADVALLLDDDDRYRRVFVHLEASCATDEARRSLRLWQQDYARKTGRKKLLPEGGSMEERTGGSYFTRIIGGRLVGKRASIM